MRNVLAIIESYFGYRLVCKINRCLEIQIKTIRNFLFAITVLFPIFVNAEAWRITPTVVLEEQYNDNFNLSSVDKKEVTETWLRGVLAFSRLTEVNDTTARIHANLSSYQGGVDSSNSQHFTITSKQKGVRSWGEFNGSYRRDTTLKTIETVPESDVVNNQALDVTANVVPDVDEGLSQVEVRRNAIWLRPSAAYQITEKISLGLLYDYYGLFFENNSPGTDLYDFNRHRLNSSLNRNLSEIDSVSATVGISKFISNENKDADSDSMYFSLGYQREFSRVIQSSIEAGVRYTDLNNSVSAGTNWGWGYVVGLDINRKTEMGRANVSVNHDIQPSGAGGVVETNYFNIDYTHRIFPKIGGQIRARAFENKSLNSTTSDKQYYLNFTSSVSWAVARWWSVRAGYEHRRREILESSNDAQSNSVFLAILYSKRLVWD